MKTNNSQSKVSKIESMASTFDLQALRTMVVGSSLGSFARAAEKLNRSQSAVSMQLKKLEIQAGTPLFVKSGNRLTPTEAGATLIKYAEKMLALNDEAAAIIGARGVRGTVRLGLPQDLANGLLPIALKQFSKQYGEILIEARIGRNYQLADDVENGKIDLALVFATEKSKGRGEELTTLSMIWAHPVPPFEIDAGDPIPLVMFDYPCEFRNAAIEALERGGHDWRLSLTTPSLAGVWSALDAGIGITARTKYMTPQHFLASGSDITLPRLPDVIIERVESTMLTPAAQCLSAILSALVKDEIKN